MLMRAVENSPVPVIADPAVLEQGKRARAARQQPQTTRLLSKLRRQRAILRTTLETAQAELNLPKDDPIRRIAAGETA